MTTVSSAEESHEDCTTLDSGKEVASFIKARLIGRVHREIIAQRSTPHNPTSLLGDRDAAAAIAAVDEFFEALPARSEEEAYARSCELLPPCTRTHEHDGASICTSASSYTISSFESSGAAGYCGDDAESTPSLSSIVSSCSRRASTALRSSDSGIGFGSAKQNERDT